MADQKITELNELTTPAVGDLLAIVDDPGGSAETKKMAISYLKTLVLTNTYRAKAYRVTSGQTLSNTTETKIQLNGEAYDPGNAFDNASDYDYTVPATGIYHIDAQITYGGSAVGARFCVVKNGATTILQGSTVGVGAALQGTPNCSGDISLTANDLITLYGYHAAGGDLDVSNGAGLTFLSIRYVCPA